MADKNFIGKTTQKTFPDGNSLINIDLNNDDINKLSRPCRIVVRKSSKGNWYAELIEYPQQGN